MDEQTEQLQWTGILSHKVARIAIFTGAGMILLFAFWVAATRVGGGEDWYNSHRPAAVHVLHGRSPYTINTSGGYSSISYFYNPPWAIIPLLPFALLPPEVGRAGLMFMSVIASGYAAYKLGAKPVALVAFLLSPPILEGILLTNMDWIVLLGFTLPPQIGLFFISTKPQMGIGVAVYWLLMALRKGGIREAFRIAWPISLATLLSFAIFGLWPLYTQNSPLDDAINASFWPLSLPVGVLAMAVAYREEKVEYAMPAGPCFAPYITFHSWSCAVLGLAKSNLYMVLVVASLWAWGIIRLLAGF